jgi:hypothetical protein
MLAAVLAEQGKPEEACAMATAVLDGTPALGSNVVVQQLRDLTQLLGRYDSAKLVSDFLVRARSDIGQRLWFFRQPGDDSEAQHTFWGAQA